MKSVVLFAAGVLLLAVVARGQTPNPEQLVQATADSFQQEGNIIHLRGHVEVRRGPTVVTADEANLPARVELDRGEIPAVELRGNVQLRIEDPDVPLSIKIR